MGKSIWDLFDPLTDLGETVVTQPAFVGPCDFHWHS